MLEVGYAARRGKTLVSTEKGRKLIAVVPEQISSAVTTGKWEKFLSDMAAQRDEVQRAAKSARFMDGIRKFSTFLVQAAGNGPAVAFEKETNVKKRKARSSSPRPRKRGATGGGHKREASK